MNYQQTLDYLYSQLPMFTRIGAAAYKKDLHNTIQLCEAFGHPENKFPSVHIAGTNGKGSCSHMLAAIFQQAGYKTALYTSPHLKDFRERIKINGVMIPEEFVIHFTEKSRELIEAIEPSFFELTVVMAFEYFAMQQVDIAIIETGLGGRLDSTNVITPEISIVTNIGLDHIQILGDSLEKIAFEKAGIIKSQVPVVIGEQLPQTRTVFIEKAAFENAPVVFAEERFSTQLVNFSLQELECELTDLRSEDLITLACDLPGIYQQKNLRTVFTGVEILRKKGWRLPVNAILPALKQVKKLTGLHGRWELIRERPYVILDVGHNEDGVRQIIANLELLQTENRKFSIVIGMVKDKEIDQVLALFPGTHKFYFTNAHLPRAMAAADLKSKAAQKGLVGEAFDHVNDALQQAIADAGENDVIVVCGSVFVVGELDMPFGMLNDKR